MDAEKCNHDFAAKILERKTKKIAAEAVRSSKQIVKQHRMQQATMVKQKGVRILILELL